MKPEVTILSAEEYQKYEKDKNWSYSYNREPLFLPYEFVNYYSKYFTTTRDVEDDMVGLLCIGLNDDYYFRKIGDTSEIVFKPVIKNCSLLKNISKYNNEMCFGQYPLDYTYKNVSKILKKDEKNDKFVKTGKIYTIGSEEYEEFFDLNLKYDYNDFIKDIKEGLKKNKDYSVNDAYQSKSISKYIKYNYKTEKNKGLFFKKKVEEEKTIYMSVSTITWCVNKKDDIAISTDNILTTTPFTLDNQYYGNFDKTYFKKFLDEKFSKEILPIDDYFIEKSIEHLDMDDETKSVFKNLVKFEEIEIINQYTTEYILMHIKDKYDNLSNDIYEKLSIALLKYISLTENNYIYKVFREVKREFLEEEYNIKKANEFDDLKDKYNRVVKMDKYEEIANNFSDVPKEELIESIYKKYPYLSNEDLKKVLKKVKK